MRSNGRANTLEHHINYTFSICAIVHMRAIGHMDKYAHTFPLLVRSLSTQRIMASIGSIWTEREWERARARRNERREMNNENGIQKASNKIFIRLAIWIVG